MHVNGHFPIVQYPNEKECYSFCMRKSSYPNCSISHWRRYKTTLSNFSFYFSGHEILKRNECMIKIIEYI